MDTMHEATTYEKAFNEFFLNVKAVLAASEAGDVRVDESASQLAQAFATAKMAVHIALCDNIDTVSMNLFHRTPTLTDYSRLPLCALLRNF
jgi:hypothetical protein